MRPGKKKQDDTEVVALLRSVLECLQRIEEGLKREHTAKPSPARIFDADGAFDDGPSIT